MHNFKTLFQIPQELIDAVTQEVDSQPELWDYFPMRTSMLKQVGGSFLDSSDIVLQYNDFNDMIEQRPYDVQETVTYPAMLKLPATRKLLFGVFAALEGQRLGRAMLTRLKPGQHVSSHKDSPVLTSYYNRFHVSLKDNSGTLFRCDDEYFAPNVGDVFWFDNSKEHEVWNDGDTDRWTLILDVKIPQVFNGEYREIPITLKYGADGSPYVEPARVEEPVQPSLQPTELLEF